MSRVHFVAPTGLDADDRPTGGNIYNRRLRAGLNAAGWDVVVHSVVGSWPHPDPNMLPELALVLAALPSDEVVIVDGLIASASPSALVPQARRLRLIVLVHMPLGDGQAPAAVRAAEGAVLCSARAVITTSRSTHDRLIQTYRLARPRVAVARPGVDPAKLSPGSGDGNALLCVAAVAAHKGHDVLLAALAEIAGHRWRCRCVGALDRDPEYVRRLVRQRRAAELGERVSFDGPRTGDELDRVYADADVLVVPSRVESFGMVIAEALARGVPVIASSVGGIPEAIGTTAGGRRPGLLVPPEDPHALAEALRHWLDDAELRGQLRTAAREVRPTLPGWAATTAQVAAIVSSVRADLGTEDGAGLG